MTFLCACLLAFSLAAEPQTPLLNLLLNSDFAIANDDGIFKNWTLYAKGQQVQTCTENLPKDCPTGLQIQIESLNGKQGAISQKLKHLPPNKTLKLTAQVRATRQNIASLQVKLKASGKELKRLRSPKNTMQWKTLELIIPTGQADELSVQLRFSQDDKAQGQTIWLTDLKLVDITE